MPTITITSTSTYIKSVQGVSNPDALTVYKKISTLETVSLLTGRKGTYVEVLFSDRSNWAFDMNNKRGGDVVLNGATPADNEALAVSLSALIT